jgi:putative FmdB family regulatory protein
MPTYEYRCTNGHTFEAFQSITADPLKECEICGASCERVLHAPAVHFKGSGFYTTDYARKGSKPSGSESKNGDSKSSDSKSESKPKPETKSSGSSD